MSEKLQHDYILVRIFTENYLPYTILTVYVLRRASTPYFNLSILFRGERVDGKKKNMINENVFSFITPPIVDKNRGAGGK